MAAPKLHVDRHDDLPSRPLADDDARALFDREAHRLLGIPGDEFLRRWDAGEYDGIAEDNIGRKVVALWMLLPLARPLDRDSDGRLHGGD